VKERNHRSRCRDFQLIHVAVLKNFTMRTNYLYLFSLQMLYLPICILIHIVMSFFLHNKSEYFLLVGFYDVFSTADYIELNDGMTDE
jgi:hypothetical protein